MTTLDILEPRADVEEFEGADEEVEEPVINWVQRNAPANYYGVEPFNTRAGKRRDKFKVKWGDGTRRIAKVNKREHAGSTENDVRHLRRMDLDEALANNVIPVVDYVEKDGRVMSFEPEFVDATSLMEYVEQNGTLGLKDFERFMSGVVKAERYMVEEKGIFHRDLNWFNILLRKGKSGLEVRVGDLDTATSVDNVSPKIMPTACSRDIRDPLLDKMFTGEEGMYGEGSEIYAMGMNAFVALNGQAPVKYDFKAGTAVNVYTGESLLGEDGLVDRDKHERAIKEGKKRIPRRIRRRHGDWIQSATTLYPTQRTSTLESLAGDLDHVKGPTFWDKLRRSSAAIALTGMLAVAGTNAFNVYFMGPEIERHNKEQFAEARKYKVEAAWDGGNLEIKNNLLELEVKARSDDDKFPDRDFIRTKPGGFISVDLKAYEMPRKKGTYSSSYSLSGQLYIEGHELEKGPVREFDIHPRDPDRATDYGRAGMYYSKWFHLKVPESMPEGTHIIAAEIYAPTEEEMEDSKFSRLGEEVSFKDPGKAIARVRVPIVVGNPENMVDLGEMGNKYPDKQFDFRSLVKRPEFVGGDTPAPQGAYFVASPADDHFEAQDHGGYIRTQEVGEADSDEHRVYYFASYDSGGNRISFTGIPLERECINGGQLARVPTPKHYKWNVEFPDRGLAHEMLKYSREIDEDFRESLESNGE